LVVHQRAVLLFFAAESSGVVQHQYFRVERSLNYHSGIYSHIADVLVIALLYLSLPCDAHYDLTQARYRQQSRLQHLLLHLLRSKTPLILLLVLLPRQLVLLQPLPLALLVSRCLLLVSAVVMLLAPLAELVL
jgi:hypothetical protein